MLWLWEEHSPTFSDVLSWPRSPGLGGGGARRFFISDFIDTPEMLPSEREGPSVRDRECMDGELGVVKQPCRRKDRQHLINKVTSLCMDVQTWNYPLKFLLASIYTGRHEGLEQNTYYHSPRKLYSIPDLCSRIYFLLFYWFLWRFYACMQYLHHLSLLFPPFNSFHILPHSSNSWPFFFNYYFFVTHTYTYICS